MVSIFVYVAHMVFTEDSPVRVFVSTSPIHIYEWDNKVIKLLKVGKAAGFCLYRLP